MLNIEIASLMEKREKYLQVIKQLRRLAAEYSDDRLLAEAYYKLTKVVESWIMAIDDRIRQLQLYVTAGAPREE